MIVRDNQPTGVLVPVEEYYRLTNLEKTLLKKHMEQVMTRMAISNKNVSDAQLDRDIVRARTHAKRYR